MQGSIRSIAVLTALGLSLACARTPAPAAPPAPAPAPVPAPILRLITDRQLWGPDFPAVLAWLPAWERAGDTVLVVTHNSVLGSRAFADTAHAETAARSLTESFAAERSRPRSGIAAEVDSARKTPALRATTMFDWETGRIRAGWPAGSQRFLPDVLKLEVIRAQLGKPERVSKMLLDSGDERRPVVLTLYHYADDAVVFAVSDLSPDTSTVQRVLLSVPRLSRALYEVPK